MLSVLLLIACLAAPALMQDGPAPGWWSGGPLSVWLVMLVAGCFAHLWHALGREHRRRAVAEPRPRTRVEPRRGETRPVQAQSSAVRQEMRRG